MQAFGYYTVRHLAFTDKAVGPGGKGRLVAGIQLADEDNDECGPHNWPKCPVSWWQRWISCIISLKQAAGVV
jgi:hypothetical protein